MDKNFKIGAVILVIFIGIVVVGFQDYFHCFPVDRKIIILCSLVLFGIMVFLNGFLHLNHKRLIENIPTSKISSLALGLVEVKGKAYHSSPVPLKSPFSNTDCVFYHYEMQEPTGVTGEGWRKISEASSGMPFYIDDGSGKVLVNPIKADVRLETRFISFGSYDSEAVPLSKRSKVKYLESFILPGQMIYVLGTVTKSKNRFTERDRKVIRRLIDWWNTPAKRKEFDLNKDGSIDKQEYKIMKEDAEAIVCREEEKQGISSKIDLSGLSDIMITKGDEEKVFIISNNSEREIIVTSGVKAMVYILGGMLLTLIGIIYLYCLIRKS